ncbi:MAG: FG-GAP-like repeat-containing protein [Gemmatimonadota bacterium]|nr:FG-GAP-like repeat-containing protein [Gemmatimonadota bacterium]
MPYALFAILLLIAPRGAFALTWDFDDGSTYGWTARAAALYMNVESINAPLHSEVVDGVWRMALVPGQNPIVQLISPVIGKDSALFDRLTLRMRFIHHSPIKGVLWMHWSNVKYNRRTDRVNAARFREERRQRYPIEWEDITVDLRALAEAGPAVRDYPATWQDTLFNFHITMWGSRDVDNYPTFLEIDSIQLTGAEELARGELSPRDIAVELGPPGTLFAAPDFSSLGSPIRRSYGGAVGDIDGDGDADLAVAWYRYVDRKAQMGWLMASNDGLGRFEPTQEIALSATAFWNDPFSLISLRGSDFDGDGLLDLVVNKGRIVEVWYNWGDEFDPTLQLSKVHILGLADGDGDGDVDLLVWGRDGESSYVSLWINDGYSFVSSDRIVFDSEDFFPFLPAGQPLGEAAVLVWRQLCGRRLCNPQLWQLTRPWAAVQEPPLAVPYAPLRLADFDGDGTVDLLGSPDHIDIAMSSFDSNNYGLALLRLNASGGWTRDSLLDWKARSTHIATADLNGDGLLDIAMIAGNLPVGPALMVWLGQPNDIPAFEGYYPLLGEGRQILTGDVNGDGDTDLVVLGKSPGSDNGGVFVLLNQGTPATAVASETAATPTAFTLGANYPNPFNPATTIPLVVPVGAKNVTLTIYNVLGQPMRQVWNGPLAASEHELTWDGRDAQGRPVAAGVYVYRLQVDEQTHTRKMVKLE